MSGSNQFGLAVSGQMVEEAVAASLGMWMDTYLCESERLHSVAARTYERPLGVIPRSQFAKWPEDQLPLMVVVSSGLSDPPERSTDGTYSARWSVGVACLVSAADPNGNSEEATRLMMQVYALATRLAIGQHKKLKSSLYPDGFANGSWWTGEAYGDDIPTEQGRTLASARVTFNIGVDDVMTEYAGPRVPLADPTEDPGQWPQMAAGSPTATVLPIGIEESLA